ncbi:MAG TPA: hypothetical protein VHM90_05325 [Phycisphaerae bacterium]|nr:hypothetical protein [Phycisphaerae bacterium]
MIVIPQKICAAGLAMMLAGIALAQTAPSPKPDLSSPKAALVSAYTALKAGDIPAAKSCLAFKDASEAELFDITYTQLYGPLKLMHAMQVRFGEAGRKPFSNAGLEKGLDDLLGKIKSAEITVDPTGNAASVADRKAAVNPSAESELTGLSFRKEGADWRIVAATFFESAGGAGAMPPAELKFMRTLRSQVAAACEATAARLARGDFKTAEEAYADYAARTQAGLQAAAAAATQK